ncbi:MAG: hypothetical protein A2Z35_02845 [Actinobacteria bacterium RBG_19FT_COMBO_36_27]|nr:MAG: hypothetical protein A2Z35_02845 [Actinobacteria bacterium RBG_19FT_COMBO_36_27]
MNILAAIDIQNLYYKFSMKSSKIDFGKLKQRIIDDVVTKENDNLELLAFFSIHHKGVGQDFKIMLEKYGYITHEKETFDKNKNMDVVIVNEIFKRLICDESSFEVFVLVAGDKDYQTLLDMVKFKGKYTIVYSLRDVFSRKLLIADKIFLLEEEDIILKY